MSLNNPCPYAVLGLPLGLGVMIPDPLTVFRVEEQLGQLYELLQTIRNPEEGGSEGTSG